MKYALLIYNDADVQREPEEQREVMAGIAEVLSRPIVSSWLQLPDVAAATTVRHAQGRTLLTDGPFVESKDYLGGFIVVDADDLDGALELAAELQQLRRGAGAIEVRPVREDPPAGA